MAPTEMPVHGNFRHLVEKVVWEQPGRKPYDLWMSPWVFTGREPDRTAQDDHLPQNNSSNKESQS